MKLTTIDTNQNNDSQNGIKVLPIDDGDDFSVDHGYLAMRKEALVNLNDNYPEPQPCLSIEQNGTNVRIGSMGEFSLVIGKAKSRKTFFSLMIVAETLTKLPSGKDHILIFDTEQPGFRVHRNGKKILALTNEEMMSRLLLFRLRKYSPEERLRFIGQELEHKSNENVGLVIIDGIRDLVTSINDERESVKISSLLMKWSERYNIHIMVILHQNKSDNNARGHLGSELVNKTECVLSVAIDDNKNEISVIKCESSRNLPFEKFLMSIDEHGLPYHYIDDREPTLRKTMISNPAAIKIETHNEILKAIFKNNSYRYGELVPIAKKILEEHMIKVGDNKTKNFIKYWHQNDLIKCQNQLYSLKD